MITVAVGIAVKDRQVFMGRRQSVDEHSPGLWEFPGGKVEDGESISDALIREFKEELAASIKVKDHFLSLKWSYPKRDVLLEFYFVEFHDSNSQFSLDAHDEHRWVSAEDYNSLEVLPANRVVLEKLNQFFASV